MNRVTLFWMIRRNSQLSDKRSPLLQQHMVSKVLMYIGAVVLGAYMLFIGVLLGRIAVDDDTPVLLLMAMLPLLALDFLMRFAAQQTPMVFIKPYLLMPMPRNAVIECYLLTLTFSSYNFLWLCLILPYGFIIFMGGTPFMAVLAVMVCSLLMVMCNSMWYLLVRTLVRHSLLWWLLPLAVYALMFLPFFVDQLPAPSYSDLSYTFYEAPALWLTILPTLVLLAALFWINRYLQLHFIYYELGHGTKKSAALKHVSQFTFLERFGLTGEYLKLELKSIIRNKAIRSRFVMSLAIMFFFSAIIAFTDIYDQKYMLTWWCFYCYSIYGITSLVKVMGPEGNYIDLLMTQRENILMLLRAKYLFHVVVLLGAMVVMLPAVIAGKFSFLMCLAYFMLTSGFVYFLIFQLAVYNKQTLPLNQKVMGKNSLESGIQLVIELVALFVPVIVCVALLVFLNETVAYLIITFIGLVFMLLSPVWLRNIYHRMMVRKYTNLEGFHTTR